MRMKTVLVGNPRKISEKKVFCERIKKRLIKTFEILVLLDNINANVFTYA